MIYFYCTSWQFFQMIVKWRISPTTEQIMFTFSILLFHFYSHIPCGMWRIPKLKHFVLLRFLLTHPVWDVTNWSGDFNVETDISTHTSRVGCDVTSSVERTLGFLISTHTSRVGCDRYLYVCQSGGKNFYSHIPCGMWRCAGEYRGNSVNFYSHIPCGMWPDNPEEWGRRMAFLLTHPVWDVTRRYRPH